MSTLVRSKQKIRNMEELSSTIGISRPTLSKYFQDAKSVRCSTRERIEEALDTVSYVPNFFATRLNRQSTRVIGVIVPYLSDPFFTSLIQAIEIAALEHGYTIMIHSANGDSEHESKMFEILLAMNVDGIIAAPIGQDTSLGTVALLKEELPIVFVDSRFPDSLDDVDFVCTDNKKSISLMVEYLYHSGDAPVFLGMPCTNSNSLEREQAYLDSARELGFEPVIIPLNCEESVWNFEQFAFETMDDYYASGSFVDSTILCANDRLAIGVVRAANRHQLLCRGNGERARCRVAGHDDHPLSAYVFPALTTVSRNTDSMGQAAVEQILDQIQNGLRVGKGVVRTFDVELRLRESA